MTRNGSPLVKPVKLGACPFLSLNLSSPSTYIHTRLKTNTLSLSALSLPINYNCRSTVKTGSAMLNAIRSVRTKPPTLFSSSLPIQIRRNTSGLGFKQPATGASQSQKKDDNMEKQQQKKLEQTSNRSLKTGDVMSHSFGEGYATRSDEEGFGGIYGGNDPLTKEEQAKTIHENHPEFDRTQGSEVAEKEKARHQKTAES